MESPTLKAEKLFQVAKATVERGDAETGKEMTVLALKAHDAIEALDRILPSLPEPLSAEEFEELNPQQVARIRSMVRQLEDRRQHKIAAVLLAKVESVETQQISKRKRRE
jgi:hypothetical protein